jgi:beta-glucosidase
VAAADVAVVLLTGQAEGESKDREQLGIPDDQLAFLAALGAQTATPLIVGVVSGGAVDVSPALDAASAVLALHQGGMEAGSALADVLWGAVNPSGALAATMYRRSWEGASAFLDMAIRANAGRGYRYLTPAAAAQHVLFPFAHGLSYTAWEESVAGVAPATISAAALAAGANVSVVVAVTNRGPAPGSRTALLFLARVDADPAEQWPNAWLAQGGIAKVHAVPPRTAAAPLTLAVVARDVSRWSAAANAFVVAPGTYTLALRDDGAGGAMGAPQASFTVTP